MVRTEKYICPKCGGQCAKLATVNFTRYSQELGVYELYADRICSECAYEWVTFERTILPVDKRDEK